MTELQSRFHDSVAIGAVDFRSAFAGLQEGVFGAGDLKVTPGSGRAIVVAAGEALIQGDYTLQKRYHVENDASKSSDAFELGGIPANASGNPRIDQIVARQYDHPFDGSGLRRWRLEVLAGTATAGATLDNRTGAAALPNSACLLADLLTPNGFAGPYVQNTHIRDRRTFARGARLIARRTAGDFTNGTGWNNFGAADFVARRLELSGAPVSIRLMGYVNSQAALALFLRMLDNGAALLEQSLSMPAAGHNSGASLYEELYVPSAGSHSFTMQANTTASAVNMKAAAATPMTLVIEELLQPSGENAGA